MVVVSSSGERFGHGMINQVISFRLPQSLGAP
jgi:hypothetical protein